MGRGQGRGPAPDHKSWMPRSCCSGPVPTWRAGQEPVSDGTVAAGQALRQREDQRRFPGGHPEGWHAWWDAAAADPALAGHVAERARRRVDAGHHGTESTMLGTHVEALKAAGFAEVGTLWQRGDNRLLCAILPPG